MNPIQDWLKSSRPYRLGVALFEAHCQDQALLDVFRQGASSYRQRRLEQALRIVLESADRPVAGVQDEPLHKSVRVNEASMPESSVPELTDTYRSQWLPLYVEMNSLRHQLIHAPDNKTRGQWAHRILQLERQCMAIWTRRDYHQRTGEPMPDDQAPVMPEVTDTNALHRRLTNLRTYVTKQNKKPDPDVKKVDIWTEEINSILKKLEHA